MVEIEVERMSSKLNQRSAILGVSNTRGQRYEVPAASFFAEIPNLSRGLGEQTAFGACGYPTRA